jgi:hypothetical protein
MKRRGEPSRHTSRQEQEVGRKAFALGVVFSARAALPAVSGEPNLMNFYHDFGGWTLVFATLISAVICDALGIWRDRFRRIETRRRAVGPLCLSERVSIGQPLLVASPSEAHVRRFLPDCPAAPRLLGLFAI